MSKPVRTGPSLAFRLAALGLVPLLIAGCSPSTAYRRSALVPAPAVLAWDGRTAPRGSLRLEGAMSAIDVRRDLLPEPGDTALHVPTVMLHGAAAIAVTEGLELGGRYSYGAYAWSRESEQGTVPIPGGGAVSGFGPEIRGTLRFDKEGTFALGLAGNYLFYSVPTSEWERDPSCIGSSSSSCFVDLWTTSVITGYRLRNKGTESTSAVAFGVYPSFSPSGGKYGHVFFALAAHRAFKNDGFSDNPTGSAVEGAGFIPLVGAGYGIKIDYFRAAALLSVPFTSSSSPVDYSLVSGFLTLGVDIPLFGGAEPDAGAARAPAAPR